MRAGGRGALQESGPLPYELGDEPNTVGTYGFRGSPAGPLAVHTRCDVRAGAITGEPVARIHLPGRVPPGFHGSWIPDA
ncbi:hypothetical protein [Streptomyces sp. NPDC092370]|uniref:hypothetical protein n=1 Tax=Streptomyces sp. NPDC092370 TaxID=3366016 RepID=UPI0038033777